MTNSEFSNEFDILYNNIMSNQAPGLDAYEKSVFLTKAQEDIVLAYYTGRNESGDYFEGSEEVRQYLYTLVTDIEGEKYTTEYIGVSDNSKFYYLDESYLFILSEYIKTDSDKKIKVVPVTADEFLKIENNPFRGPSKSRVLRLDTSTSTGGRIQELVTKETIKKYIARVLRKPIPIIIGDLGGLKIDDFEYDQNRYCELPNSLHRKILDRAVLLAKASFASNPGQ
jgi:hypothetical protein